MAIEVSAGGFSKRNTALLKLAKNCRILSCTMVSPGKVYDMRDLLSKLLEVDVMLHILRRQDSTPAVRIVEQNGSLLIK